MLQRPWPGAHSDSEEVAIRPSWASQGISSPATCGQFTQRQRSTRLPPGEGFAGKAPPRRAWPLPSHPSVAQFPASRIFSSYFKLPPLNRHLRTVSWVSSPSALRLSRSHPLGLAEEKPGSASRKDILVASELTALG